MKKLVLVLFVAGIIGLFAETVSIESPLGSFKLSVDDSEISTPEGKILIPEEIAKRIEILENKYVLKLNKFEQKKAQRLIEEIYQLLALLPGDISASVSTSVPVPVPVPVQTTTSTTTTTVSSSAELSSNVNININVNENENEGDSFEEDTFETKPTYKAMSAKEFQQLLLNVENESFGDDQLSVIRIAANNKYFKIDQLVQLLDVFTFSDEKIKCVRIVYPKIVDKDNSHNLLGAFTYSDDKEKVEKIINQ